MVMFQGDQLSGVLMSFLGASTVVLIKMKGDGTVTRMLARVSKFLKSLAGSRHPIDERFCGGRRFVLTTVTSL